MVYNSGTLIYGVFREAGTHFPMAIFLQILAANVLLRLTAVCVAAVLSYRWLARVSEQMLAVACGLLVTIALTHLIPEAVEAPGVEAHNLGLVMLGTVFLFLCIERILMLTGHTHGDAGCDCPNEDKPTHASALTLMTGAGLHNFVDGVLIAGTFMMSEGAGWLVAAAVLCHEVPQTTGYMVILKSSGLSAARAVRWCILAAGMAVLGGIIGWGAMTFTQELIPYALVMSATSFLFIAFHSLLPEVFRGRTTARAVAGQLALFAVGTVISLLILGGDHDHAHGHDHDHDHNVTPAAELRDVH